MRIVIAGGTGFLGSPLARALASAGHEIVLLSRHPAAATPLPRIRTVGWTPNGEVGSWAAELSGALAVVNLAGESIASHRWSPAHKQRILDSRVYATRSLAKAVLEARPAPGVMISGSAVGYYGPLGEEAVSEEHPAGNDFLATVCRQWEAEALAAGQVTRVLCLRTGLPLERDGGALPRMLLPFRIGMGGQLGSGRQYWPWIHRDDWVDLVRWAIETSAASGALNATAPNPVTNAEFARALGRALHRPALFPTPALALRLALGEMADALLLSGQRALPTRATNLGFTFRYAHIDTALKAIFGRP